MTIPKDLRHPGGGVGVLSASPPTDIPTPSEWAMLLLAGLLGLFGMRRVRRA